MTEQNSISRFKRWFGFGRDAQAEEERRSTAPEGAADKKGASDHEVEAGDATGPNALAADETELGAGAVPASQAAPVSESAAPAVDRDQAEAASVDVEQPGRAEAPTAGDLPLAPQDGPPVEAPSDEHEHPARRNWFQRLTEGLRKSSQSLGTGITDIFTKRRLDEDTLQDLEDILIQADLGVETAARITERVAAGRYDKQIEPDEVKRVLAKEVADVLRPVAQPLRVDGDKRPFVIMVVGVNGTGKTTTIGKLAAQFKAQGKQVVLAAGDTFRAAAVEQIKIWGERVGAPVVAKDIGADAAGLAYDALQRARAERADVLMIDTAGRLQNKSDLMAELQKIVRVLRKQDESAPHAVVLVLDATTGQNAVNQVEIFQKVAGVTGLVMTKLDGTARGGILVAVAEKFKLPVHAIGVGEGVADLQPFEADDFARSIAGLR
ncbi:signal recognition particle-docking protein FtsY [Rhodoligotrophos defluvii]|uniref:signal recognition particle-docking protein FtsY n=1 Tax=Rhodoligotrophos defluvii TaxID=2561934 RepID=UPI0010C93CAB|nr:signal recognition particle-docking protein FtsY [Rhodoligotrophos defluvii]